MLQSMHHLALLKPPPVVMMLMTLQSTPVLEALAWLSSGVDTSTPALLNLLLFMATSPISIVMVIKQYHHIQDTVNSMAEHNVSVKRGTIMVTTTNHCSQLSGKLLCRCTRNAFPQFYGHHCCSRRYVKTFSSITIGLLNQIKPFLVHVVCQSACL